MPRKQSQGSEGRSRAGRKGGRVTAERHGSTHFRHIGHLGGLARGRARNKTISAGETPEAHDQLAMSGKSRDMSS